MSGDFTYLETSVGKIRILLSKKKENRPVIVFLHDSLGCIERWKDFPDKLCKMTDCNMLIYDRQGYGQSCGFSEIRDSGYMEKEADILNEILRNLRLNEIILFGHSDGGSISLIYGAKYPDNVSGIITEGAHVFVEAVTITGMQEVLKQYITTELKSRLEKYHFNNTEAMFYAWTDIWLSSAFRHWSIEYFLPLISCPVFVIQGDKDEFGTLDQVETIINKVGAYSKKMLIPEARHTPHEEKSDIVLSVAAEFINGLSFF
ncbi:MAG: alpha/beta fold hydrolase [Deltaproteobacteria bacterium]